MLPSGVLCIKHYLEMEQKDKEKQFTALIEEYKRVICKICYMYATDGDNFKDLYQDVVINLWKGYDGYQGKGKPSSWIYRVGLNTCISFYRQQQRRGEHTSLDTLYGLEAEDDETVRQLREMYHPGAPAHLEHPAEEDRLPDADRARSLPGRKPFPHEFQDRYSR